MLRSLSLRKSIVKNNIIIEMAHFIIAGRADDAEFARAEMLSHHLQRNLPDFHVKLVPKLPSEWEAFAAEMFDQYGWKQRPARDRTYKDLTSLPQMVWRESGELIESAGHSSDYLELIKITYNEEFYVDENTLREIARENLNGLTNSHQ
ncbi:putative malate dehydrogenase 1B [Gaertneriomyces sp. JEL0708]|nr:putative malate dehydrogenase 1B [Gaertneriomyces sp. JEL0708]